MNIKKSFFSGDLLPWIIILVLLIIILGRPHHPAPQKVIIYDTIKIRDTLYTPSPIHFDSLVYYPATIDTQKVLEDYFSSRVYADTLLDDTTGQVIIRDSVSQNRIITRQPYIKIIRQTEVIREKPKIHLHAGFKVGGSKDHLSFGPSLILNTRQRSSFGISYDIPNRSITFSIYWRVF
jgi:hypothetical protein